MFQTKNYNTELELDHDVDTLALYTVRHLTRMARAYFDDQMEQKGLYGEQPALKLTTGASEK